MLWAKCKYESSTLQKNRVNRNHTFDETIPINMAYLGGPILLHLTVGMRKNDKFKENTAT